jgi:protein involved in polysaccharide export with SLBB domain
MLSHLSRYFTAGTRNAIFLGGLALAVSAYGQSSNSDDFLHNAFGQSGQSLTSDEPQSDQSVMPLTRPSTRGLKTGDVNGGLDQPPDLRDLLRPDAALKSLPQIDKGKEAAIDGNQQHRLAVVDPPTEYQIFVKKSTGMELPIFGASLFNDVPSTFAPLDRVPVTPDYTIGPGDELDLRVWGQINANEQLVVDRGGDVYLPQVGRINVAGLRFIDLQPMMKTSIGRVFRNFDMTVNMGQLRSIQVFVMGRARRPGTYTVSSLSTLVNALFASGGPSPQGSLRDIQVKRGGRVITTFDLYDLLLRGDKSHDVPLQPGDVIYIPKAGPRVAIGGSVETAAIYEMTPNTSLRDVLAYAGGLSPVAAGQHAILERVDDRATLTSENIELTDSGLDTSLQDGDIVKLLQIVPRFNKTVTLKGNVADAIRLPWHEGMKVSEVIPDKRALLTRDYWNEHNRLEEGSATHVDKITDVSLDKTLASAVAGKKTVVERDFNTKNDVKLAAPDINWSYATIERLDAQTLTTHLIPFNLGKVVLEHDRAADPTLEPGDVITVFSQADFITPQAQQTRLVHLEGEVKMAGVYSVQPGETLRQLVERAGGLTDKAYLYAAEFTRDSTRREQEKRYSDFIDTLEKGLDQSSSQLAAHALTPEKEAQMRVSFEQQRATLERFRKIPATGRIVLDLRPDSAGVNSIPDLPLENDDRFLIPSAPSTVNVVGTVYNQGSFVYRPGETANEYLKQAGGPMRYADRKQVFIIRADGSVWSRANHGSFDKTELHPGDTVVVPTTLAKGSTARMFLDWSQVISGFGIGAAAVNVLR